MTVLLLLPASKILLSLLLTTREGLIATINFDILINPTVMTKDRQRKSFHWFLLIAKKQTLPFLIFVVKTHRMT